MELSDEELRDREYTLVSESDHVGEQHWKCEYCGLDNISRREIEEGLHAARCEER